MTTTTTMRKAGLGEMVEVLRDIDARKLDVVARADSLRMNDDGHLVVPGVGEPELTENGVTTGDAVLGLLDTFEQTASQRLEIPIGYWRRCGASSLPLLAANVNHWLTVAGAKRMLVRAITSKDGDRGVARALLSDSYRPIDHLDVVLAVLQGIKDAGVDPTTVQMDGDLTSSRMSLRITAPGVAVDGGDLVAR